MQITVIEKGKEWSGDGYDYWTKVEVQEGDQKLRFIYRNIFDFGLVINPDYEIIPGLKAGMAKDGYWWDFDDEKLWQPVRELTEFEKRAIDYLYEINPLGFAGAFINM